MNDKQLIIWDWNGTILNDIDACIASMNVMLEQRNMKLLDEATYKKIFTFPVQDYYKSIGFNFEQESFEKLSVEYIDLYKKYALKTSLQEGVVDALEQFKKDGFLQVILSASEQKALEKQVNQHRLDQYFDALIGLNNIFAKSKLENAIRYLEESATPPQKTILIGDTYHDYEVARSIGCDCLLVNNGHQDLLQYNIKSTKLVSSITELMKMLNFSNNNFKN
ncbi:MAG: HAD family hydrolase [Thiohalospira sp.]